MGVIRVVSMIKNSRFRAVGSLLRARLASTSAAWHRAPPCRALMDPPNFRSGVRTGAPVLAQGKHSEPCWILDGVEELLASGKLLEADTSEVADRLGSHIARITSACRDRSVH